MKLLEENPNRLVSSLLIAELVKNGITHFYVSPGMRNAPLLSALKNNNKAKIFLGIDERAQAYRAMGSTKASGIPSVLICTSGTAMLNYAPALAEAAKNKTSLIVLTADRPDELIWSDANQTMEQNDLYSRLGIPSWKLPTTDDHFPLRSFLSRVNLFIDQSRSGTPIHFNIPFREPLDGKKVEISTERLSEARELFLAEKPQNQFLKDSTPINYELEKYFLKKNGLLVIGELPPNTPREALKELVTQTKWPVFLDVLSGLKYDFSMSDGAIPTFDHPEVMEYFKKNKPEVVIHVGGRMTSKHYHRFLDENPEIEILHISNKTGVNHSPLNAKYLREVAPDRWASQLIEHCHQDEQTAFDTTPWIEFVAKKRELIENSQLCYPLISKTLIESLPEVCDLYVANSTVIRSFDSYAGFESYKDIRAIGHRGVSGIEGFMAATQGLRESSDHGPVVLVIGDVSFLHDLNSLALLEKEGRPLLIVLVNNYGGGIFSLLPLEKGEEILPLMSTPHEFIFEEIIKSFHHDYKKITDKSELKPAIEEFNQKTSGVQIIEVMVDNDNNTKVYQNLRTVRL